MALGRGLESLIPPKPSKLEEAKKTFDSSKKEHVFYIEIDKIKPNPLQPRQDFDEEGLKDLAESIRTHGILQPLVVTKQEIELAQGRRVEYHIIAGERRLRAAKLAGFNQVPVIIRETNEQAKLELALIENLQRTDLNPIEEARAYQKLANDFSLTQVEIAQRVAKSREAVANKIRLLTLPYDVQQFLVSGRISEGHAKVLLQLSNPEKQIYLAKQVIAKNLTVRTLEDLVRAELEPRPVKIAASSNPELAEYQKTIEVSLGTPVSITGSQEKGRLAIAFHSREELERIIKKLAQ